MKGDKTTVEMNMDRQEREIEFEDYIHDSMEDIQKCLNCTKEECTNCLWMND